MREVYRIDDQGLAVLGDILLIDDNQLIPTGYIDTAFPNPGFIHPKWDGTAWVEGGQKVLSDVQKSKMDELETNCNNEIYNGFDWNINNVSYHFYLPLTAQSNFQGARAQFKDGKITTVRWTVFNNASGKFERIDLDWTTFEPICDNVFTFVDDRVKKLRDTLEPQVYAANINADAVKLITW